MSPGRQALVTGGAGFIGHHLAARLLGEGWGLRVLDDLSLGRSDRLAPLAGRFELLQADVRDAQALDRALRGVEVVFHLAALSSVPASLDAPLLSHEVNLGGTLQVLEAARRAGVRRLVYAASSAAYGDEPELPKREGMQARPRSPYALQKVAGELYCRLYTELYGLETVSLRYFNVYGPGQDPEAAYAAVVPRFVQACLSGRPPAIHGDGGQTRDFTFVDDAVAATLLAADAEKASGRVVNVGGGRRVSILELWQTLLRVTGRRLEATHEAERPGDVRDSLADLSQAAELLGYAPVVDLDEGLRRTVEAFRAEAGRTES